MDTQAIRKGWLSKFGVSYKLKFAVLTKSDLQLYNSRDATEPGHVIPLQEIRCETVEDTALDSFLGLKAKNAKLIITSWKRRYELAAQNSQERKEWIDDILNAKLVLAALKGSPVMQSPALEVIPEPPANRQLKKLHNFKSDESLWSIMINNTSNPGDLPPPPLVYGKQTMLSSQELARLIQAPIAMHDSKDTSLKVPTITWNQDYQNHFWRQQDVIKLKRTMGAFRTAAASIARSIIDDYHMGTTEAGIIQRKDTFSVGDITLYFAADYLEESDVDCETAHKRLSHELTSINHFNSAIRALCTNDQKQPFHTPLLCIIDYKGFRMVAYPTLPPCEFVFDLHRDLKDIPIQTGLGIIANNLGLKADRGLSTQTQVTCDQNGNMYALNLRTIFPLASTGTEQRLRPEFIKQYGIPLCSDAFSDSSDRFEAADVIKAQKFLLTEHLQLFIENLDQLNLMPIDSSSFTSLLHEWGINIRHLGCIAQRTKLPYIRSFCYSEMLARSAKNLYNRRLRSLIMHFRKVQATKIDTELAEFAVRFLNQILTGSNDEISTQIAHDYNYHDKIDIRDVEKNALFLALQYHCSITFSESVTYIFNSSAPLDVEHIVSFNAKVKQLDATPVADTEPIEKATHLLASHVASIQDITSRTALTSQRFHGLAQAYLPTDLAQARIYAMAAYNTTLPGLACNASICLTLMEVYFKLTHSKDAEAARKTLNEQLRFTLDLVDLSVGKLHPLRTKTLDFAANLLNDAGRYKFAVELWEEARECAANIIGHQHLVTSGYLTKLGRCLMILGRTDEALDYLQQSNSCFESSSIRSDITLETIALNHWYIADLYKTRGDLDTAIQHATEGEKIRQSLFGPMDDRAIQSTEQIAELLTTSYKDYTGVITPNIKKQIVSALSHWEKVFKYCKLRGKGRRGSSEAVRKQDIEKLLSITRTMITMKFQILATEQKDYVKIAREDWTAHGSDEDLKREIVLKLLTLLPTVYIDEVLSRCEDDDPQGHREMVEIVAIQENPA